MTTLEPLPRLTPACLKVYTAICSLYDAGEPVTCRGVAERCGMTAHQYVQQMLRRLAENGWVSYEQLTHGRHQIIFRSVRPLRRVELFAPECFGCQATA